MDNAFWIVSAEKWGTSLSDALEIFDQLPAVATHEIIGRWRGRQLATGHDLDGMLGAWYGKEFKDAETVHPLLFGAEAPCAVDPRHVPLNAATARLRRLEITRLAFRTSCRILKTHKPAARLRTMNCRGKPTLSMIYDRQPIIDFFRKVSTDLILGMMDRRGMEPLFFAMRRDTAPSNPGASGDGVILF